MNDPQTTAGKPDSPAVSRSPFRMRNLAFRIGRIGIIVYLALGIMFVGLQRKLIYHPNPEPVVASMAGPLASRLTEVQVATDDGLTLNGWLVTAMDGSSHEPRPLVLYFPGNSAHRARRLPLISLFNQIGCDVLIVDYRGYGGNPGSPSEEGLARDAKAVWDYATRSLMIPPQRIVLFGESLGGGVAIRLACELCEAGVTPRGLIIQASFSSMVDAGRYHFGWLPVNWILQDRYPSGERIGCVTCPILHYHGELDEIVPFELGRKLFEAAPAASSNGIAKRFVALPDAGHNDILHVAAAPVEAVLREFLNEIGAIEKDGTPTRADDR